MLMLHKHYFFALRYLKVSISGEYNLVGLTKTIYDRLPCTYVYFVQTMS